MFKSPPIIILLLQIADAIDISSGVSPEDRNNYFIAI